MQNEKMTISVERILEPALPQFIEMRWQDLDRLKNGIEQSDFTALKKLSHKLLGTPGTFGFYNIVELAREMEVAIEHKDLTALSQIVSSYENFMNHFKIKIKNEAF